MIDQFKGLLPLPCGRGLFDPCMPKAPIDKDDKNQSGISLCQPLNKIKSILALRMVSLDDFSRNE